MSGSPGADEGAGDRSAESAGAAAERVSLPLPIPRRPAAYPCARSFAMKSRYHSPLAFSVRAWVS